MADIAIAVVNHNTRAELRACLAAAVGVAPGPVIVVDNASSDGSVEMVRREFPGVVLHVNPVNRGYGAAANQAVAACTSRYVLLLNADTRLTPGAPLALAEYLDTHPRVAVAGPRLLNPDGTLQPSCHAFPTPATALLGLTPLRHLAGALRYLPDGLGHLPAWAHDHARPVDWVKGAALALRRRAFEAVGGFDESFFMYWEETDLCRRLAAAGWETHFAPVADVVHVGEASTRQQREAMSVLFLVSLHRFSARHHTRSRRLALTLVLETILRVRLAIEKARLRVCRDPASRRALSENLAALTRALHG